MEQYLLANVSRYQSLVQRFQPQRPTTTENKDVADCSNIVVAIRIRPILDHEILSGQVPAIFPRSESGVVDLHELKRVIRGQPTLNSSAFRVGNVFGADCPTKTLYTNLLQPLLPSVWEGGVGTLFAFGQTGSGKTHTISGLERLLAETLFDGAWTTQRKLYVSMFELAGNSAYASRAPFSILEDSFGNTQLVGAQELSIKSKSEFLELIENATSFRQTAGTEKNDGSSRSHAICRIRAANVSPGISEDGILYLIDLAGSEAARDLANHSADRLKETREINISLSILKDCIRGIASTTGTVKKGQKGPYIPFRQSTLTKVLKHVFDPSGIRNSKTAVLACINPSFLDTPATKNTLRYAHMLCSTEIKYQAAEHSPAIPKSWSNKFIRSYITKELHQAVILTCEKSGNPVISPSILAPHESGAQLLAIPLNKFIARCLRTKGVTESQAKAFHAKLWRLHIDSTRASGVGHKGEIDTIEQVPISGESVLSVTRISTRDLMSEGDLRTFKDRIRPGMVVRCNAAANFPGSSSQEKLVMILCPQNVVGKNMKDALGNEVNPSYCLEKTELTGITHQRYLCALVLSGGLADSYEVSIWRQIVVDLSSMETEVSLEYDPATRYYHIC
ncbi:hypothetical protein N7517_006426 [Penicillium concentricum]|uniref:Kinesin motor domain-containing protein n=1 Tax=Penicillium concentricum TaxID=293559 RepID=A0A9W9S9Q1_9EURO|nr:uncharacterized protein N7517_006426 [Penicillium concentricum]KAJ5374420.1 hypothetical protein N7517_006426 [Penicillium concentricum]